MQNLRNVHLVDFSFRANKRIGGSVWNAWHRSTAFDCTSHSHANKTIHRKVQNIHWIGQGRAGEATDWFPSQQTTIVLFQGNGNDPCAALGKREHLPPRPYLFTLCLSIYLFLSLSKVSPGLATYRLSVAIDIKGLRRLRLLTGINKVAARNPVPCISRLRLLFQCFRLFLLLSPSLSPHRAEPFFICMFNTNNDNVSRTY